MRGGVTEEEAGRRATSGGLRQSRSSVEEAEVKLASDSTV